MQELNMEQYAEVIHASLVRPQMYMGCDRNAFLALVFVSLFIAGPLGILKGNYTMFVIGIISWLIGHRLLIVMGKQDPYMRQILKKNFWQLPWYPAVAYAASNEKYPAERDGNINAVSCAGYLPYCALIDPAVILLKDGSLLGGFEYSGNDLSTASIDEKNDICRQTANALKNICAENFALYFEAIKVPVINYPTGEFSEIVTYVIDKERKQNHENLGIHFETKLFCFVKWQPNGSLSKTFNSAKGFLSVFSKKQSVANNNSRIDEHVEQFKTILSDFVSSFSVKFKASVLEDEDFLNAISLCVTGQNVERPLPEVPWNLDTLLACEIDNGEPFLFNGEFVKVISVDGFPPASKPAMLLRLDQLSFEYRWSTRYLPEDFQESHAKMLKEQRTWESKTKPLVSQMFGQETTRVDKDAVEQAADAIDALSELSKGNTGYGYYTGVIIVRDKDYSRVEQKARLVVRTLQECLFTARVETRNTLEALMGSFPGDVASDVRRVFIKTANLVHFLMLSSVWMGEKYNPCAFYPKKSPCLIQTSSDGGSPFKFNLHVDDIGHTLILGPTGSGKSTMLSTMLAQIDRYPNSQVFYFDKGRSVYPLISAMSNASFYELGADKEDIRDEEINPTLCPLSSLETDSDITWAADYIEMLVALNNVKVTPVMRKEITAAIREMARGTKTSKERSMTFFQINIQNKDIADAIQPFTESGSFGKYLDGTSTNIKYARYTCFEIEKLMNLGDKVVVPVLLYLFHEIEKRLDGRPSFIVLDEAWVALGNEVFCAKVAEWLRVLRKMNCAVILATQSISQIMNSAISSEIFESCKTRVLLANPEAQSEGIKKFYMETLQLTAEETNAVASAVPKREYFYVSPYGKRKFNLNLGELQLSFVGASGREDLKKVDAYKARYGEMWPVYYLNTERHLPEWANYYEKLYNKYH